MSTCDLLCLYCFNYVQVTPIQLLRIQYFMFAGYTHFSRLCGCEHLVPIANMYLSVPHYTDESPLLFNVSQSNPSHVLISVISAAV